MYCFSTFANWTLSFGLFSFPPTIITSWVHLHHSHISSYSFDNRSSTLAMRTYFKISMFGSTSMTCPAYWLSTNGYIFLSSFKSLLKRNNNWYIFRSHFIISSRNIIIFKSMFVFGNFIQPICVINRFFYSIWKNFKGPLYSNIFWILTFFIWMIFFWKLLIGFSNVFIRCIKIQSQIRI